ncbi:MULTISPECIES: hypothetical protein [Bacillus cereus group]|uniref:Uncharacterized protein n=1 Tax=Bacillus thuringiensis TaxID=1428 RepID=A0A9X6Z5C5_BACTU|nr:MULTISPECIES: hypothetical protein [Bacillus cereus group]MCU5279691.1 hypothetical protein [Bacillus cereus]MEC3270707.1 hypothetical protein [Bacillus thuringiensis]PFB08066.1 hypothetical protein CN398_10125 [Bacillus thuringiensis]
MISIDSIKISLLITLSIAFVHISIHFFLMELKKYWEADLMDFLQKLEEEGAKIEASNKRY